MTICTLSTIVKNTIVHFNYCYYFILTVNVNVSDFYNTKHVLISDKSLF